MKLSLKQGEQLVKLARDSIISEFSKNKIIVPKGFEIERGVFVTLKNYPDETLRGCIGFTYPFPLAEAIVKAAKLAAFEDIRFSPLKEEEIKNIIIEISILTEPKEVKIKTEEDLKKIKIGEDGLIIQLDSLSGLLLPQVAVEEKWDAKTFIEHTCLKAGLGINAWKDPATKVYKFQAQIFKEESPNGNVVEVK